MRSLVKQPAPSGIKNIVRQQFEVAALILNAGLVLIIETETDIHYQEKAQAESLFKAAILEKLVALPADRQVMLKLMLPEQADFCVDFVRHPRIVKALRCRAVTRERKLTPLAKKSWRRGELFKSLN